jgi:hypothetical protein
MFFCREDVRTVHETTNWYWQTSPYLGSVSLSVTVWAQHLQVHESACTDEHLRYRTVSSGRDIGYEFIAQRSAHIAMLLKLPVVIHEQNSSCSFHEFILRSVLLAYLKVRDYDMVIRVQ